MMPSSRNPLTMSEIDFEKARFNMIEQQIRPWEVLDQRILDILASTPREDFVPPRYRNLAFADVCIPLGQNQVMMRPIVEGRLLQALAVEPSERILEVGTGSGYLTACLAKLGKRVLTVDIFPEFVKAAQPKLKAQGISNVLLRTGDAAQGWGNQRYDVIVITGSLPVLPDSWQRQQEVGGRLFVIVGEPPVMEALLITRLSEREWNTESLFDTELPPLLNALKPRVFEF
jgi:protein-L-isoaspartate(D-aspartate) O-methyltransferase